MRRSHLYIALTGIALLAWWSTAMSTSDSASKATSSPVPQSISLPFCATTDPLVSLESVTLTKSDVSLWVRWEFANQSLGGVNRRVKAELVSDDSKYYWSVVATTDGDQVTTIETYDSVSKQRVVYRTGGASVTGQVIGGTVEVVAPLPGAPATFRWFASAAAAGGEYVSNCPAGWLAQYPPVA